MQFWWSNWTMRSTNKASNVIYTYWIGYAILMISLFNWIHQQSINFIYACEQYSVCHLCKIANSIAICTFPTSIFRSNNVPSKIKMKLNYIKVHFFIRYLTKQLPWPFSYQHRTLWFIFILGTIVLRFTFSFIFFSFTP